MILYVKYVSLFKIGFPIYLVLKVQVLLECIPSYWFMKLSVHLVHEDSSS